MHRASFFSLGVLVMAAACAGDTAEGSGDVRVMLAAEDSVREGLDVGPGPENTKDYGVRYTKFLVAIGDVRLSDSGSDTERVERTQYVSDLTNVPTSGVELFTWGDLDAGQWDEFGFSTVAARGAPERLSGATSADAREMAEHGYTYWIEGVVERSEGDGGPVEFVIQIDAKAAFSRCTHDGEPGVAVVSGGTSGAVITIHGDHLWFNAFPTGGEGTIERRAAWILAADRDGDGVVHTEDLEDLPASEVFKSELGYSLDGAPYVIETALDWARAQLSTQGHFQGEGECIWKKLRRD